MRINTAWYIIVALFLGTLQSCETPPQKLGVFKLLPQVRQFDISGVSDLKATDLNTYFISHENDLTTTIDILSDAGRVGDKEKADLVLAVDSNLSGRPEGYTLSIGRSQISITAKDKAGLFYGLKSLTQLLEDAGEQEVNLPLCHIEDYPLLTYRAVHLDVKHHRETREYYYAVIDKLSDYKVNAIILELEDKIKFESHAAIGSADALSIAEWKAISDYAYSRNIAISPLVQGLGHASFILKHNEYKDLRDDPESDWAFDPLNPDTYNVQFDLYLDAMKATPHGRYLHVGGDEVHTTGRGSGKSALELQLIWLNKVCKFAAAHNRIPIFWDDMPLKHAGVYQAMFQPGLSKEEVDLIWEENEHKLAEFLDLFPKNCIYMRWNYASPQAIGNTKAMDWFQKHGMQVMGATAGQRRWILMPQDGGNLENIKTFARNSIEQNLDGLLLTLWDDDSPHFELYWRGILAFAEYTWAGDARDKKELLAVYRQREFSKAVSTEEYAFVDQLEAPAAFFSTALINNSDRRQLIQSEAAVNEAILDLPDRNLPGKWTAEHADKIEKAERYLKVSDSVASKITAVKNLALRNIYTLEIYEQVNQAARFAPLALLALRDYDVAANDELALSKLDDIRRLRSDFEAMRNRLEEVYGRTRILNKPEDYILDQDHHAHLANQSINFDWQFYAELLFLEKIEAQILQHTADQ